MRVIGMDVENEAESRVPVAVVVSNDPSYREVRIEETVIGEIWKFRGKWHWVWKDLETNEQVLEGQGIEGSTSYRTAVENLVRQHRERN